MRLPSAAAKFVHALRRSFLLYLSPVIRIVAVMLLLPAGASAELVTVGEEFQVNTYTAGQQVGPHVAPAAAGGFVAVWSGLGGQDGSANGVFGQRYTSGAARLGDEFQINTFTEDSQGNPSVDSDAQGGFVVVWSSYYQDGSSYEGVFGQRYDSGGQAIGSEFQINTYTVGGQSEPAVAMGPAGDFVVVWSSYDDPAGQDGSYGGIFAQRYDSAGIATGTEFLVNTYTEENQFGGVAAKAADGSFLLVWAGAGPTGSRIHGRLYDSLGQPTGPQFEVNDPTLSSLRGPDVDRLAGGGFVVAWAHDPASFEEDIRARRLDASAAPLGTEFQVNTYTSGRQISADVTATADGGFAIGWQSGGEDGSGTGVFVRLYDELGVPRGNPSRVNITTTGAQGSPALAETSTDEVVAVWSSALQDGSFEGIFGVRLVPAGIPLSGKRLLIKNPAAGASKNKLVLLSKDTAIAAPSGVEEDPRCPPLGSGTPQAGATLRIAGLGGDVTIDLPCVGWTANASKTRYLYRDGTGATCKRVTLTDGGPLKAICKGPQVAYALGAAQGNVGVAITMGETLEYCVTFGAATLADVKQDGSNGRTYKALDAAAPSGCP
jgi:hypothetical protein